MASELELTGVDLGLEAPQKRNRVVICEDKPNLTRKVRHARSDTTVRATCIAKNGVVHIDMQSGREPGSLELDLKTGLERLIWSTAPSMPRFSGDITSFSVDGGLLRATAVARQEDLGGAGPHDYTPVTIEGPCNGI